MEILENIAAYRPQNEQEQRDQSLILDFLRRNNDEIGRASCRERV